MISSDVENEQGKQLVCMLKEYKLSVSFYQQMANGLKNLNYIFLNTETVFLLAAKWKPAVNGIMCLRKGISQMNMKFKDVHIL